MRQPTTSEEAIQVLSKLLNAKRWNPEKFSSLFKEYWEKFGWFKEEAAQ
jgi:hypothetical protein